jgi:precorrin-2 dehydrogenase/sirohydrochlorin ferrochelatase
MTVFPLFENIDQKTFLIVGGGDVAKRKIDRLLQFTNRIIVIAEKTDLKSSGGVRVLERPLKLKDLEMGDFVIAATNDKKLNRTIAEYCNSSRIPVNVVDDPRLCSFIFPSIVKRGDLTIGISTGGTSPAYAQLMRKTLEKNLPDHIGGILERMGKLRKTVPAQVPEADRRAKCYKEILSELLVRDNQVGEDEINEIIRRWHYHLE